MPAGIVMEYESYQSAIGSLGVETRSLARSSEAANGPVSLPPIAIDKFDVIPTVAPVKPA
jgi:hypothetical protein